MPETIMEEKAVQPEEFGREPVFMMRQILETLLDILYPRHCPVCREIVAYPGKWVCPRCRRKVHPIREPKCKKCGKPLDQEEREYCHDCQKRGHPYERGLALLAYEGWAKEAIYQIKFHNKREYLDFFAREMAKELGREVLTWGAQAIVPVPLHKKKRRKRGFNQAELLADKLGTLLEIPVRKDLAERVRYTEAQKELSFRERRKNIRGAFRVNAAELDVEKIILVDDIYTTGSTVDEMTEEFQKKGARQVYFLTICIGRADY